MSDVSPKRADAGKFAALRKYAPCLHRFSPWALLLFAIVYFGMYYRSGLNLGGEGGTVAVVAQRIMEGQRPIADVFLGYNLLWFYPVVWLFQLFGPGYIALRIFFFVLCTITGLLAYRVVWRVTARPLYAFLVGLLIIYVPGMIFRNYMGLLGVLNILFLLEAYVLPHKKLRSRWLWIAGAGLALSFTFLVRVEVGFFLAPVYGFFLLLYAVGGAGSEIPKRLVLSVGALLLTVFLFFVTHLPFYIDAQKRGFAPNFVGQYEHIPDMLLYHLEQYVGKPAKAEPAPVKPPSEPAAPAAEQAGIAQEKSDPGTDPGTRPRPTLQDINKSKKLPDRLLALDLYLPVLLLASMGVGIAAAFLLSLFRRDISMRAGAMTAGAAMACSLAFFPQYYFFRPDLPHLVEFMIPFTVALAICAFYAWQWLVKPHALLLRILAGCFLAVVLLDMGTYVYYADKKPSAGTSAARRFRTFEFKGENGVRVLLQKEEYAEVQGIYDTIMAHTSPEDYIVCYPYSPTVHFMTNRRSYLYNLYVDNATASNKFHARTIAELEQYKPAIILIDNRAINKIDISRFSNWAADTYQFIRQHYRLAGKFGSNEIYVRPDKFQPSQS